MNLQSIYCRPFCLLDMHHPPAEEVTLRGNATKEYVSISFFNFTYSFSIQTDILLGHLWKKNTAKIFSRKCDYNLISKLWFRFDMNKLSLDFVICCVWRSLVSPRTYFSLWHNNTEYYGLHQQPSQVKDTERGQPKRGESVLPYTVSAEWEAVIRSNTTCCLLPHMPTCYAM